MEDDDDEGCGDIEDEDIITNTNHNSTNTDE